MFYVVYFVTGILAGIVGGLLGTGGCALMMPVIRFGFDFDPAFAVGTTLTAVVFTAASGAIQLVGAGFKMYQQVVDLPVAAVLGVGLSSAPSSGPDWWPDSSPTSSRPCSGFSFSTCP